MSNKWKEAPIDDLKGAEQFKVGDNIYVYDFEFVHESRYTILKFDRVKNIFVDESETSVHWKQCRKLIKIESREWELAVDMQGTAYFAQESDKSRPDREVIKVREVLDDV